MIKSQRETIQKLKLGKVETFSPFTSLFFLGVRLKKWNAKVGSQEISGMIGRFGLGVQNEAEQRLTEFCQENALVIANTLFQQHKR